MGRDLAPVFVAIDVGSSGARACAFDLGGRQVAEVRRRYRTAIPRIGWAEQDPDDWSERAVDVVAHLPAGVKARVAAIGLTGQCPTVAGVDRRGRPVTAGLMYRDNRAVAEAAEMRDRLGVEVIHRRTGHTPEAFHVGPKVLWFRRHQPELFARVRHFLQPRDIVAFRLVGQFVTDESHANATLFFDLVERAWAADLLAAFDVDPRLLPSAVAPWTVIDRLRPSVAEAVGLAAGVPVVIGAGDSQCAAFGAGVIEPGAVSEMSGSSSCLNSAVATPRADLRITHYSHVVPGWFTTEVGLNTTGAALAWAVKAFGFNSFTALAEAAEHGRRRILRQGDPTAAPLFLPHLADGERDDPSACGVLTGLTDRHDRAAVAYSVIEGVAAAVVRRTELLHRAGSPIGELRVAGGGARLAILGQVKADLLGVPVLHLQCDSTALGVAMLAATATGHQEEAGKAIAAVVGSSQRFDPARRARAVAERHDWFDRIEKSSAAHRMGRTR